MSTANLSTLEKFLAQKLVDDSSMNMKRLKMSYSFIKETLKHKLEKERKLRKEKEQQHLMMMQENEWGAQLGLDPKGMFCRFVRVMLAQRPR